jgi:pyruvate dehydrogenase E2 component (dihydrolipoamide acetyltransferase)
MPIEITMPRLSDTMEEGTLVKWRVKVGDAIKSGDVLADVETDKATMELQSFDDGTVAALAVAEGDTAAVGKLIIVLANKGESVESAAAAAGSSTSAAPAAPSAKASEDMETQPQEATAQPADDSGAEGEILDAVGPEPTGESAGGRMRVSPLAAKLAEEHGVDLARVQGTGPDGRIIKRDVLAVADRSGGAKPAPAAKPAAKPAPAAPAAKPASPPTPPPQPKLQSQLVKVSNMRKTIAKRLLESKTTIPHFTVTLSVNMDPLMTLRQTLNAQLESQGVKLSVNDFVVRASALALLQHPAVNSSWTEGGIQQHGTVNIGVAVALPEDKGGGLVVPVLFDAQNKGLRSISSETRALAQKARETGLSPEQMSNGTFTISNLGMMGVEHFEAIINPPQAAILAVGAALQKPVVRDSQIVIGQEMSLTLSGDHRVIDGAVGATFLNTLKTLLENPAVLLV